MDEATARRHIAWLRHCAVRSRALADEYDTSADRIEERVFPAPAQEPSTEGAGRD